MKIVCESCGAKYSIADEKVAGKVFKIRCKRCSEVIVVRGDQQPPEEDATRVYDYAVDAVWHVVVNGEQQGPFSPPQIGEMLTNAQIDWEAYVWREGFDNWLPARDVPDLVEAVTGQAASDGYDEAPAEAYEAPAPVVAAAPVRAQPQARSMGADPFADDGGGADPGLFGGGGGRSGGDLFSGGGAAAANPFGGGHDDGVLASAPNPRVASAQSMTGARNENSVLFSLKNLQALATGGNESGGGSAAASPAPRAGFATGEGSGLIDIRALASATGLGGDSGRGDKDELLSMGGGQTGAFSSLGSPMLAPPMAAEEPTNKNTLLYVGFGVMALVVLGMGGGMFYLITREPAPVVVAAPPVAPVAAAGAATPATGAAAPAEEPTEGEKAAAKLAAESADKSGDSNSEGSGSSRRRRSGGGSSAGAAPAAANDSARPSGGGDEPAKAPAKRTGPASIDDLLGEAMAPSGGGGRTKAAAAAPAENLPEQPSRDEVISALRGVEDAVKACGGGQHGVAMAAITVAGNTGRVSSVNVSGQFQGTPIGSCVARAVRGARFSKFSRPDFKVTFPFRI